MVSENAVVVCDTGGIHLYHIPELSSAEDSSTLSPVWEWPGGSKWFCGSVCETSSQHPVLYLQSASGTHTITLWTDAGGRDPVVVEHHVTGKLPVHLASLEEGGGGGGGGREDHHRFTMKGRKGLYYNVGEEDVRPGFATYLLGKEELAGAVFSVDVESTPEDANRGEHKVNLADFDERTGRILIGTSRDRDLGREHGTRIYIADLPP